MRFAHLAPAVPVRDRGLVAAGVGWIAAATLLALGFRPLADALFIFVVAPLAAAALAGVAVLVWAGAASGTRWARGLPLGRAPAVLAALLVTATGGAAGGWARLADLGDALVLRAQLGPCERAVAALHRGDPPARPGAQFSAPGTEGAVVLTAAPLRVAFILPRGWAGDPFEFLVYDPTGAVAGAGRAARAAAVPGSGEDSPRFRDCSRVAPGYYHCAGE